MPVVMTTKVTAGIALLAALMTTGCSGDTETVRSGQDVADMIGCTGWSNTFDDTDAYGEVETVTYDDFVRDGGTCRLNGRNVGVYYFLDDMARTGYVQAGSAVGGNYLIGDVWVIEAPSDVLDQIEAEHGGERSFD